MRVKLLDCVELLDCRRVPLSTNERTKLKKIYPYYGAQGIIDYVDNYIFDGEYILVAEDGNNLRTLNENIATWATGKFWVNNHAHILGGNNKYNLKYIFYLLNTLDVRKYITGSAQPKLNQENLLNISLDIPDRKTQDKIVEILSGIDDQIARNDSMTKKLQVLSNTIYRRWFYQLEGPTKGEITYAPQAGREIFNSWRIEKLQNCIEHITTGLNPRDNFVLNTGNILYITVKNLTHDGFLDLSSYDTINKETKSIVNKRSKIRKKDILYASIAPLGRCYLIQEDPELFEINESVFAIRAKEEVISPEYLYLLLQDSHFNKQAELSSMGSIFKGIRMSVLNDFNIIVPDRDTMKMFTEIIAPYLYQMYILTQETDHLKELKKFLLPLLINGRLLLS